MRPLVRYLHCCRGATITDKNDHSAFTAILIIQLYSSTVYKFDNLLKIPGVLRLCVCAKYTMSSLKCLKLTYIFGLTPISVW